MGRTKKKWLLLSLLAFLPVILAACGEKKEEASAYSIYYINQDMTKTVAVGYEPDATNSEWMIEEFLEKLFRDTDEPGLVGVPDEARLASWNLDNSQLYLYFDSDYSKMDNVSEVLCRAAVVKTLIQVDGVEGISFYVGDAPLTDVNGTPVGVMTAESFVENPGEQINAIQNASITLYFADKKGTGLVQEVQEVHYSGNISLEKLVMEQLLKGPKGDGKRAAIPKGTKLVNVSVLDGVGYVNLDEGFLKQDYEVSEPVVIYSIVNSLAELPNVNKVQISVNGDSNLVYREKFDLSATYERDLDYVDGQGEKKKGK